MSGTLFVVATPIGNLEDITLRALRVLREAGLIAAEDTRRTAKLLAHYSIPTPTISFHEHNSRTRIPLLLARLSAGVDVALVSDAGTPGIADPGVALVRACLHAGVPVDPIPGPSAPLTAAIASGFSLDRLTIMGFCPRRSKDRISWISEVNKILWTVVFFETPRRIRKTLVDISEYSVDRPICVTRELTKVHQEVSFAHVNDKLFGHTTNEKGEFTVVLGPVDDIAVTERVPSDIEIYESFCLETKNSPNRKSAISSVANKYCLATKLVYSAVERHRAKIQ